MPDYSKIDTPDVLSYVFYPRQESGPCPKYAFDHFIPVDDAVAVHCRFYRQDDAWPWILPLSAAPAVTRSKMPSPLRSPRVTLQLTPEVPVSVA